jgi:anti-anti-sigma factor
MSSGSRGRLLDRIEVAYLAALGEVAEISDWYEQVRVVVVADGAGGQVVRVTGELATGTAAYLDAVLEHQISVRPARLVVDLSAVSFLGVRGLAALVRAIGRADQRSVPLAVVVGNRPDLARAVRRTLGPEALNARSSPDSCPCPGSVAPAPEPGAGPHGPTPRFRSHVLEPHLGSPRRARVLLRRACLDWALGNAYDDAALVVNELVTNAVRHAGTPCRLTITLDGDGLRIAARDRGPLHPALLDDTRCGAGLHLVATLAQRWGVLPHADGKTVWARFPPRAVV